MTGTLTALLTFRVSSRSKPYLVPSLSIEVKSISPAPRPTASCAHSTTSRPVDFRPPLTYASQHGGSEDTCLASMATTMHCEPKRRAQDVRMVGSSRAAEFKETLYAPSFTPPPPPSSSLIPPPIVQRLHTFSAQR